MGCYDCKENIEGYLMSIGAIKHICDVHEDAGYLGTGMDKDEVYAKVTSKLKKEYPQMNDFTPFYECIEEILSAPYDNTCPFCEKAYNE